MAGVVHADTSSDSDTEEGPADKEEDDDDDSSATESGSSGKSSEHPSPRKSKVAGSLPPEDLEPKQLKKLETMKESPA